MNEFEKKIQKILKKILKIKNFNKKQLFKLKIGSLKNWDSLEHLKILLECEKEFKIKFSTEAFTRIKTVKEIRDYIYND